MNNVSVPNKPRQIEFARLGINYTVMSKRKLRRLVEEGYVSGWDDPRMPTLCGLRRRGYTPAAIREFITRVGVAKVNSTAEYALLESCLRDDLNAHAQRAMAVLRPLKLTIVNYPEGKSELIEVENNPNDPEAGTRMVSFSRNLYIEREDFMEHRAPKYKRLCPGEDGESCGLECRLKGAYLVRCAGFIKDESGEVVEVLCEYDPESRGGDPADGRKVKGATLHWVDANNCADAEIRLYSSLFSDPEPDAAGKDFIECLNPESLEVLSGCKVEKTARRRVERHALPVPARGLFLPRQQGFRARPPGIQPRRRPQGQLQEVIRTELRPGAEAPGLFSCDYITRTLSTSGSFRISLFISPLTFSARSMMV